LQGFLFEVDMRWFRPGLPLILRGAKGGALLTQRETLARAAT